MHQTRKAHFALAVCLSFLAGYVDALGFIELGGVFVSFMSGNSTRLGVAAAMGDSGILLVAGSILCCFVTGVVAGSLLGHWQRKRRMTAILTFVALLLLASALAVSSGLRFGGVVLMALAMGAVNTLFEKDGEVSIALTYMTGTLVRMGQRIAGAILGGPKLLWLRYMALWLGLVCGAGAGAFMYGTAGLAAIWLAAGLCLCLTMISLRAG